MIYFIKHTRELDFYFRLLIFQICKQPATGSQIGFHLQKQMGKLFYSNNEIAKNHLFTTFISINAF